ncbi:hypothetical protein [Pleurocapsa sp. PCC 7319]|uniref:hypothetical protein n=1 Tax=Pleurocapsa sp. PCC 7319 TaxID=118161 RepID=UPI001181B4B8|nr:hypothetical protein [Pleurocapsa sp. PCC 7319]
MKNNLTLQIDDSEWKYYLDREVPLQNYPQYPWQLKRDQAGNPIFKNLPTISRHLFKNQSGDVCPFGDLPSPVACLEKTEALQDVKNAYLISALRFELNPYKNTQPGMSNQLRGIPQPLKELHEKLTFYSPRLHVDKILKSSSQNEFDSALNQMQQQARFWYVRELIPKMNANPFAPQLHNYELPADNTRRLIAANSPQKNLPFTYPYSYITKLKPSMIRDLTQYVRLQNSPYLFFDLMQWLERDVLRWQWQSLKQGRKIGNQEGMIKVMTDWHDQDGKKREEPIIFPIGVPIDYIQFTRRQNIPFITVEFAKTTHGKMTHWLQEHIWQRFCYQYPDRHHLYPSEFFTDLGQVHPAFADSIYEFHVPNIVNPANTHFWYILQHYLPMLEIVENA